MAGKEKMADIGHAPQPFECQARRQSLPEPADCDWPKCGCDPYADKVIGAIEESGFKIVPADLAKDVDEDLSSVSPDVLRSMVNFWRGMYWRALHDRAEAAKSSKGASPSEGGRGGS